MATAADSPAAAAAARPPPLQQPLPPAPPLTMMMTGSLDDGSTIEFFPGLPLMLSGLADRLSKVGRERTGEYHMVLRMGMQSPAVRWFVRPLPVLAVPAVYG